MKIMFRSIYLSVYLSVYLSIHLSIYLKTIKEISNPLVGMKKQQNTNSMRSSLKPVVMLLKEILIFLLSLQPILMTHLQTSILRERFFFLQE